MRNEIRRDYFGIQKPDGKIVYDQYNDVRIAMNSPTGTHRLTW